MKRNKLYVGLTGGIASGKSLASKKLAELGACILDADEISRHALDIDGPCYARTISEFGSSILNEDGTVNRKKLSDLVFGDLNCRHKLNSIIHPYVKHTLLKEAEAASAKIVVFDVPLLIECGLFRLMDKIIVITANEDLRVRRIILRNHISPEEAKARIAAQMSSSKQSEYADYLIRNEGTVEAFEMEVEDVFSKLKEMIA